MLRELSVQNLALIEDVRVEHLLGDESSEYPLGTATIS